MQPQLTPPRGAEQVGRERIELEQLLRQAFRERVEQQPMSDKERAERVNGVESRVVDLLDSWSKVYDDYAADGIEMQYQRYELDKPKPLLREMLDSDFISEHHRKFRVNRSLRDVESEVNLFLTELNGRWLEEETS